MADPDHRLARDATRPGMDGPRLDPATLVLAGPRLTVRSTARLLPETLARATTATVLEPGRGWRDSPIVAVRWDDATLTLSVELDRAPRAGALVRLVVRGTGPAPAMGRGAKGLLLPLAGTVGGRPAAGPDGADAVLHATAPARPAR